MRDDIIKVFIGYDPVESVTWHTMAHSILRQCSQPVALVPVNIEKHERYFQKRERP